jgi:hypothetical protein
MDIKNISEIKNKMIFETFMDFLIAVTEINAQNENFDYFASIDLQLKKSFSNMSDADRATIKARITKNIQQRVKENEITLRKEYGDEQYKLIVAELMKSFGF